MEFDSQNIKELLEKGAHLIIDDSLPMEELRYIAQIAAQEQLANLTVDSSRIAALKAAEPAKEKEVNINPQQH